METQGLLGIVLLFAPAMGVISGEELSLRPEVTSSSIRMDATPLAGPAPVQVIYDLRPLGGETQVHPELGIPPAFTERFVMQSRYAVADGLALVSSTGLGLNRTGSVWRLLARGPSDEEQSLIFYDTGLELTPTRGVTVRFSTRLARQMDEFGRMSSDWSGGATVALTPVEGTTINVGAYRSEQLDNHYLSNIFTAGLDSRVGKTPLTISLSGWSAIEGEPVGTGAGYSGAGATGLVSWQWSDTLWLGVGAQWDASDGWNASYTSWRYYLSTVLKVSHEVSFALELSRTVGVYESGGQVANSAFEETSLRLSRCHRLTANLSTEISVEIALGDQRAEALADAPLVQLAAQLSF